MNKKIKTLATVALSLSFAAHGMAYANQPAHPVHPIHPVHPTHPHDKVSSEKITTEKVVVVNNTKEVSDKTIRNKLTNSINAHDDIDHDVDVHVKDGAVTLRGEVDNKGEKALAERLAVNTPGVTSVKNLLVIDKD